MAILIIIFLVSLGFSIVNPFLPIYMRDIGAGGVTIALFFSGYSFSKTFFPPFIGSVSDRKGRSCFIIAGLVIYAFVSFCYLCMPHSMWLLLILGFLQGVGAAMVRPIALAFVGERAPKKKEGSVMGTFAVPFYCALSIGPIAGGFIGDRFGMQAIFLALFALCVFSLAIALIAITDVEESPVSSRQLKADIRFMAGSHALRGLVCFIFARSFGISICAIFLPIFVSADLQFSNTQVGVIMASGTTLTVFFIGPFGKISDRLNRRVLVAIGGGAAALLTFLLPFAAKFCHLLILSSLIGFFSALSLPSSSALLIEEGNRYGMGKTVGFFNSIMGTGFIAASLIGGFLIDIGGKGIVFHVAGLIGVLGICSFCLLDQAGRPKTILVGE